MRKLEIGPGDIDLGSDWEKLDVREGYTYCVKWGFEPIPVPDNTFDIIFTSHCIEHIPWYRTLDALKECYRVLKKNGEIEIWTVDFSKCVDAYLKRKALDNWDCAGRNKELNYMKWIASRIFAYEKNGNEFYWHKAIFDFEYLKECLENSGFVDIERIEKAKVYDHGIINLGVKGIKK